MLQWLTAKADPRWIASRRPRPGTSANSRKRCGIGTFQPHAVVRVEIAKHAGGVRRLAVPLLIDRIVERALLAELDAIVDPQLLPWSFAYRHGLGVRDAVALPDGGT